MTEDGAISLKGQFLLSMPGLTDPNFSNTVTCICEHTSEGAVGIVINRLHPTLRVKDIYEELEISYVPETGSIPIHIGGPVHQGEIFILHGPPFDWDACRMITPSLAMSNSMDILKALASGQGPNSVIIALGCAGWGPYQLEAEIKQNAWLTCPIMDEIVFSISIEERWEASIRTIGIDPALLMDTAGHA